MMNRTKLRGAFRHSSRIALLVGVVMVSCGQSEQASEGKASEPAQVAQAQPGASPARTSSGSGDKPNIVVIMGDDIGMWNIGAYHRGLMAGRTP